MRKGNIKLFRNDIAFVLFYHIPNKYTVHLSGIVYSDISKMMIPTPQSHRHSAKYSGKNLYFG